MRTFTLTTLAPLAALLLLLPSRASSAQEATDGWVRLAPAGEKFVAHMPAQPAARDVRVEGGALKLSGRAYTLTDDGGATYILLALDDPNKAHGFESAYLDEIAEVAWEALVRAEYERLRDEGFKGFSPGMDYRREFEVSGRPAREYLLKLKKGEGPVYVCADGQRVYVVAAFGPTLQSAQLTRFVKSFSPDASYKAPASTGSDNSGGMGPGRGVGAGDTSGGAGAGETDYATRVFLQKEVGAKAVITHKPDPGYTESARKFNVAGVVRLRAVLRRTGEVTNLAVIKALPHGLTERAILAARGVKFRPAQKDGRDVSQYITFEYNFNIY